MNKINLLSMLQTFLSTIILISMILMVIIFFFKLTPDLIGYNPINAQNIRYAISLFKEQNIWMILAILTITSICLVLFYLIIYRRRYFDLEKDVIYYYGYPLLDDKNKCYIKGKLEIEGDKIIFSPLNEKTDSFFITSDKIVEISLRDKKLSNLGYWLLNNDSAFPAALIFSERTYLKIKYKDKSNSLNTITMAVPSSSSLPAMLKEKLTFCKEQTKERY